MPKLLLVEDNQLNRDMLGRRLERKGYQVVHAVDGREAVAKALSEKPDLILMDLSLPHLNGWDATRQIKADPAAHAIPVIALTAHAMVGDREEALAAGCDDYEMKPIDLTRLLTKIQAFLEQAAAGAGEQTRTLLLVDDNDMNRDMLSRRLRRDNYRITLAASGPEALDYLRVRAFDLVLLDVMMPEMSGLEVLGVIRASHSLIDLPVIMVTAKEQGEDVVAALQLGANDYVTKPLNYPVVLARIQTQLAVREAHRAARLVAMSWATPVFSERPARALTPAPTRAERAADRVTTEAPRSHRLAGNQGHAQSGYGPAHSGESATLTLDPPRFAGRASAGLATGPEDSDGSDDGPSSGAGDARRATWVETATDMGRQHLDDYEILGELGRGGMGIVYKARHKRMNRLVALKVIDKQHLSNAHAINRFYSEVRAAAQLSHPNIVLAYDAGQFDDTHFFAMEFVEGVDLNQLVKQSGPLPVNEACSYIRQAARGLQHACERGLVHRDIKPSNLLVTWTPLANAAAVSGPASGSALGITKPGQAHGATPLALGRATIKILDMGLALLHQPTETFEAAGGLTRDGRVVGTADYMAPEQWMNAHKVDIRADLYSLGCTFYYLLTAQVPFPGEEPMEKMLKHHLDEPAPLKELRPEVPPKVVAVVERLLAKKPEHRHQQPWEVDEALR